MTDPRDHDAERQKVFRRMTWVYVYLPPILALLVGTIGAAVLAFLFPIEGTTFWLRWLGGILVILVLPAIGYLVWDRMRS